MSNLVTDVATDVVSNFVTDVMANNKEVIDKDPVNAQHIINAVKECRRTRKIILPGKMRRQDAQVLQQILEKYTLIGTHLTGISNDPEEMIAHIAKLNINWSYSNAMQYIKQRSPFFENANQDRLETIWNTHCNTEHQTLIFY